MHANKQSQRKCKQVTKYRKQKVKEQQCQQVPRQNCYNAPERVCDWVTQQQCKQVPKKQCRQVKDRQCKNVHKQVPRNKSRRVPVNDCGNGGINVRTESKNEWDKGYNVRDFSKLTPEIKTRIQGSSPEDDGPIKFK